MEKAACVCVWVFLVASPLQMDLLQEFYETTLEALKDAKNDRLWFKTNTKVMISKQKHTQHDLYSLDHIL